MAIGNTTQYGSNTALMDAYGPGFVNAIYYNNQLFGLKVGGRPVFPMVQAQPDVSSERFHVATTGNTSAAVFTEGAAQATPVAHTFANIAIAHVYYRAMVRVTGHVVDAVRLGASPQGMNTLDTEMELSKQAVVDLNTTTALGAANSGLQVAIDSTTTYGGQARGSAAWWESTETNENGSLTIASMRDGIEAVRDNDKGGRIDLILAPYNQLTNYVALTGDIGAQNGALRVEMTRIGEGAKYDATPDPMNASFMGIPMVGIGDLTNEVIFGLDTSPGTWSLAVRRPLQIEEMPRSGDDYVWQISTANVLVCKQPKKQWKLVDVTA